MMDNSDYVQILLLFFLYEFIKYAFVKSKNYVKLEEPLSTPSIQPIRRITTTTTDINISGLSLLPLDSDVPFRRAIIYPETPEDILGLSKMKSNCKRSIKNRQVFCKAKRSLQF